MAKKQSKSQWHNNQGRWSRSFGHRNAKVRLYQKEADGVFYRATWVGGKILRASIGTRDRSEAERLANQLLVHLLSEEPPRSKALSLGGLWRRYSAESHDFLDNAPMTRYNDAIAASVLIGYFGAEKDVRELSINDQAGFIRARSEGGIRYGIGKETRPVRMRAIHADLSLLKRMLKWATQVKIGPKDRLLEFNPLAEVRSPREKNPNRNVATWERFIATREAIKERVDAAKSEADRHKWILLDFALVMAESSGRRIGAIRHLQWSDIDFTTHRVTWRAEFDKMRKEWVMPMSTDLREEAKLYRIRRGGGFTGWLFPTFQDPEKPVSANEFSNWLKLAEKHAGLPRLKGTLWHAYRRSWATARKGRPLKDTAAAGGWSDTTTLLMYQQVEEAVILDIMNESRKVVDASGPAAS
jgi:integrase